MDRMGKHIDALVSTLCQQDLYALVSTPFPEGSFTCLDDPLPPVLITWLSVCAIVFHHRSCSDDTTVRFHLTRVRLLLSLLVALLCCCLVC